MRFSLKAKAKLGFIDGKCAQPAVNSHACNVHLRDLVRVMAVFYINLRKI